MLFSVRDVDVLRLLCWCQNIRPQDLNSISTKAERENLMALGFIKLHERSGTLTLTGSGRALLELIFNGAIPSLSLSYHGAAIERRIRIDFNAPFFNCRRQRSYVQQDGSGSMMLKPQ